MMGLGGRGRSKLRAPQTGPVGFKNYNPFGRAMGPEGKMDVVYDQRPEEAAKDRKLKEMDINTRAKYNELLTGIKQQDADTRGQRADAYEFGVKNPIGRVLTPKGGKAVIVNPRAYGETGVDMGTMTEDDKMAAAFENALGLTKERGNQARTTEETRQENRLESAGVQQENNLNRDENRENLFRGRQPSSSQQSEALRAVGRQVFNQNPGWQKWIQFDDKGNFVVVKPNMSGTEDGPDLGTWQQINQALYGPKERSINQDKGSDASALTGTPGQQTSTKFTVNGKNYNIPANRVQEFLKRNPNARRR
jgi:hypothetical protein